MTNIWIELLAGRGCQSFWNFLGLRDLLHLSASSHAVGSLQLSEDAGADIIARYKAGHWRINSYQTMRLIHLCRILRMVHTPLDVYLLFDDRNGRILLDLGSTDQTPAVEAPEPAQEDEESQHIFRNLEKCSYDEYDDFQPRHPMPKDRAHRRGDSYFNSDIETVVNELGGGMAGGGSGADMRNLAKAALEGDGPAAAAPATGNAAKNRILNRTKNNYPGGAAGPAAGTPTKPGLPPTAPKRA